MLQYFKLIRGSFVPTWIQALDQATKPCLKWTLMLAVVLLMGACQVPPLQSPQRAFSPLPQFYKNLSLDTLNSGDIRWRSFFRDSMLVSLIDEGLRNNLDLMTALQRVKVAQAQLLVAKGRLRPFVSAGTSAGQRRFGKYTMDGVGNFDTRFSTNITPDMVIPEYLPDYYLGLQSNWEVDIWGKLNKLKKAALAGYLATIEGNRWLRTTLIAEIASNYNELLALDLELDFIKETSRLQTNQLEVMRLEKEAGRVNELAIKQLEAQLLNTQGIEREVLQQIVLSENRLNYLLGRYPQPVKRSVTRYIEAISLSIHAGLPTDLLRRRPDIKQAEHLLEATHANLDAARLAFYPSLTIAASVGLQSFNTKFLLAPQSFAFNLLGGLAAPLINKSLIKAEFETANAAQLEALYHYQKTLMAAYIEVYNQLLNIENLRQIHTLKSQEVGALSSSVEIASQLYLSGRGSYIEIILTRQNAIKSNFELIEVKRRQYDAVIALYRSLGGGWD